MATITAETRKHSIVRAAIFAVLPILALIGTYNYMTPKLPDELRINHPTPPSSIIVYPPSHFQQTHNPFHVE